MENQKVDCFSTCLPNTSVKLEIEGEELESVVENVSIDFPAKTSPSKVLCKREIKESLSMLSFDNGKSLDIFEDKKLTKQEKEEIYIKMEVDFVEKLSSVIKDTQSEACQDNSDIKVETMRNSSLKTDSPSEESRFDNHEDGLTNFPKVGVSSSEDIILKVDDEKLSQNGVVFVKESPLKVEPLEKMDFHNYRDDRELKENALVTAPVSSKGRVIKTRMTAEQLRDAIDPIGDSEQDTDPTFDPKKNDDRMSNKSKARCRFCKTKLNLSLAYHHMFHDHGPELSHLCPFCDKESVPNMPVHIASAHFNQRIFRCDECLSTFLREGDYNRHRFRHSATKDFGCDRCHKGFYRKEELDNHKCYLSTGKKRKISESETFEFNWVCEICGVSYAERNKSSLNCKVRLHNYSTHYRDKSPYVCRQCAKPFASSTRLRIHEETHTSSCPFKCLFPGCGKAFKTSGYLSQHRIFHREPKFACLCGAKFHLKFLLRDHKKKCEGMKRGREEGDVAERVGGDDGVDVSEKCVDDTGPRRRGRKRICKSILESKDKDGGVVSEKSIDDTGPQRRKRKRICKSILESKDKDGGVVSEKSIDDTGPQRRKRKRICKSSKDKDEGVANDGRSKRKKRAATGKRQVQRKMLNTRKEKKSMEED